MDQPLVSVIIPLYNQGEYIRESIESVLNQSYINWEIIVVDDDSTDNGASVVQEIVQKDSRIKYCHQSNSGPSVARNKGILKSKGKYILPLDGDDKIGEGYLKLAVEYLETHNDCKLVYCKAELFGKERGPWMLPDYSYDSLLWDNMIFCTAMFRRSDYDKSNGYNPNMIYGLEDWDFWLSLLSRGDIVHRLDETLFYYRIKKESRSTRLNDNHYDKAVRQLYNNHPALYTDYLENIIIWRMMSEKNSSLQRELSDVYSSKSYKLGYSLLSPFRFLASLKSNISQLKPTK